jgi:cell fate regulator YaaT (PSP1 superfamily)
MGCASCSNGDGTPRGCKNNGTCSSGGCNKLEVYDWLGNMSLPAGQVPYDIVEIRFKNSRKNFYRNASNLTLCVGDVVAVEASPGHDIGVVSALGELARIQVAKKAPGLKPMEIKKIYRIATQEDVDKWASARNLEKDVMFQARTLALKLYLQMKISDVEYQGDLSKATFYYTADTRVDFRQLIKDMADTFKIRIEMRQIGSRQEASRLGGIGSCGRELCCSTWLTDFRSVSTSAARYQQLSLNPQKLAGQCGKLKCCLNYELDMYVEAIKSFPKADTKLHTAKGMAYHVKTDVFKKQMWFAYERGVEGGGLVALNPDRVREIIALNKEDKKPADLKEFMQVVAPVEPDYSNVVGQDSLNRFDNLNKKKKRKKKPQGNRPQGAAVAQNNPGPKPVQKNNPPQQKVQGESNKPKAEGDGTPNANRPKNKRRRPNNKNRGSQEKNSEN